MRGRPAREAARRPRALRQGRLGQPSDLFLQGPRRLGRRHARRRARASRCSPARRPATSPAASPSHAARLGLACSVFIPDDLEAGKVAGAAVYRPRIIAVRGNYDDVNRLCTQVADRYGWGFANINLRAYYAEGAKTYGFEIAEQLGWRFPRHVVSPVAGGTLLPRILKGFNELREVGLVEGELPSIHAAQAAGCAPVVQALLERARVSRSRSSRTPSPSRLRSATRPTASRCCARCGRPAAPARWSSDDEIVEGIQLLAETEGIFTEPAGGVTVAATRKLDRAGAVPRRRVDRDLHHRQRLQDRRSDASAAASSRSASADRSRSSKPSRARRRSSQGYMTTYRAVFRCAAGCPGDHSIWQAIYHCPTCGGLLQVVHDIDALRHRSSVAWMRLFDERYKRTAWPYGSGVWGKKEWVCPGVRDENVVSMDEGGTNIFWADRYGRELGVEDLWVKMCGNSHTGSFKDLGMTVLVSVVKQIIADGGGIGAVACASTGDTSAALAALCRGRGHSRDRDPAARARLSRAARPAARERRAGARARHRLRRLHGDRAAPRHRRGRLSRELDEQPAARGTEDAVDRDRAAVRLGSAGRRRHSRRQSRQRQRARRGVPDDAGPRADRQAPAAGRRAGRRREPALSSLQEQLGVRAGSRATDARATRFRSATRSRSAGRSARCRRSTASSSRPRKTNWPTPPRAPIAPACSTARTPPSRWPRSRSSSAGARSRRRIGSSSISTANGLKFSEFKTAYHTRTLAGINARHANPPVELPNDYDAVRRAIERLAATTGGR